MFSYHTILNILAILIKNFQKVPLQAHAYTCKNENNINAYNTPIRTNNKYNTYECCNNAWDGKRMYKTVLSCNNHGSATIEATLVIPIFLMAMLALYTMGNFLITKNTIYEGFQEAAQYMAEYEYLYENQSVIEANSGESLLSEAIGTVTTWNKIKDFIDDEELVNQYVDGGLSGIWCTYSYYDSDDGYVYMEISYKLKSDIPLIGVFSTRIFEQIKQKAYTGMVDSNFNNRDVYVYITENASVYHKSRNCYHISLNVTNVVMDTLEKKYSYLTPCEYCARNKSCSGSIYVTDSGSRYHYRLGCSGLKRTVYRVKLSDTNGLPPCSACGKD